MSTASKSFLAVMAATLLTTVAACNAPEESPQPANISQTTVTPYSNDLTADETPQSTTAGATPSATVQYSSRTPSATLTPTSTLFAPEPYESDTIPYLDPQNGFIISQIAMLNPLEGWALGGAERYDTDHVFYTNDGGVTWKEVTPPEPIQNRQTPSKQAIAHFTSSLEAYVLYRPSYNFVGVADWYLWHTVDGGQTWTYSIAVTPQETGEMYPFDMEILSNGFGYLFFNAPTTAMQMFVFLSTTHDHGLTWEQVLHPHRQQYMNRYLKTGIDFIEPNHGWISIDDIQIVEGTFFYNSVDGGLSWTMNYLPTPENAPGVFDQSHECFTHSPTLFSSLEGIIAVDCSRYDFEGDSSARIDLQDYLYRTEDGGETWVSMPYPGGELSFLTEEIGWALGKDIYKTTDGGNTWEHIKRVNWWASFNVVNEWLIWAVAKNDGETALVKSIDGGATWQIVEPVLTDP